FSRSESGHEDLIDIGKLLHEVADLCRHTFDRRIAIVLDDSGQDCHVIADSGELHSVFVNIAVNARDAMPQGGTFTIDWSCGTDAELGDCAIVSFSDTGTGIPESLREHIFEPFFTTKPPEKGTGLGLAGAFRAVRDAGGRIDLESQMDTGSTFRVLLPLAAPPETPSRETPQEAPQPAQTGQRLLLVEDEDMIRELVSESLRLAGYEVQTAENGIRALDWFREHHAEIDLVIMDMIMPHMSGADCLTAMAAIDPQVRAVVTSGFIPEEEIDRIPEGIVRGRVPKPSSHHTLVHSVAEALA
ncbi:MAG: hybrid sensor histidine kinase/response regulator, partial [Planctomycetota bacterium]